MKPVEYDASNPDQQALWWHIRLTASDMGDEEYRQFEQWWLADRRHGEALAGQYEWWQAFEDQLTPEIREECAAAMADEPAVKTRRLGRFVKLAMAAAVLASVLGGWLVLRETDLVPPRYATQTGQNRTVVFKDGSVAYLNTRTRIQWLGGSSERCVALLEGEALFDVVADAARPFRVLVDRSEIRVLGTRFNVYRKKTGEVLVTVLDGAVQVQQAQGWMRILEQNQQLAYHATRMAPEPRPVDAHQVVKWREGAVDIKNAPLLEVIDELSRYTDQPILADDPRLKSIKVMAVLQVRDVHKSLALLEQTFPITVTESQGAFRLAYRDPSAAAP